MSLAVIGAGIGIVSAGYSVYSSIKKNAKAKELAAKNIRPVFNSAGEIEQVYDLAGNELDNTEMMDFGQRNLEQNQMAGIDAILKSGGKADFEVIQGQFGNSLRQLIDQNNRERSQRIANFNNAAYNKGLSEDAEFSYNQDAPYKDNKQLEADLRAESGAEMSNAISTIGSTVANYGTATTKPGAYGNQRTTAGTIAGGAQRLISNPDLITSGNSRTSTQPNIVAPTNVNPAPPTEAGLVNVSGTGMQIIGWDYNGDPIYKR